MVFDAFRPEKHDPSGATQANSGDLFNRIHGESPIRLASVQGGSLEPGGNQTTGTVEPPPHNTTIINKGGDASATARATATATAKANAEGGQGGAGGSSNVNMKSVFTAPPALGGGECTVGLSGGALGFALGGQFPSMPCIREKTGAEKAGQLLDFTVRSGVAAMDGMNEAVNNVDKANAYHKQGDNGVAQAHLDVANAQRKISAGLATDSVVAAQKVLGPDAGATPAPQWNAGIFNDNSPPPAAAPVEAQVVHHPKPRAQGQVSHAKAEVDCPAKKSP